MTQTRGAQGRGYTLITPANHYPSRLPEFGDAPVVKLVTPRLAPSRIGEYLVTLGEPTTATLTDAYEMFFYVLDGTLAVDGTGLGAGGFAYVPPGIGAEIEGGEARFLLVKRAYEGDDPPAPITGHRDDEPFADTPVPGFRRRELLPTGDPAFDFNMSLLAFDPGVGLDKIEIHDEEHGLYMTQGQGIYALDGDLHDVEEGDFIYMAPYCPQGFTATGPGPAEYLLYKDVWRDGFPFR